MGCLFGRGKKLKEGIDQIADNSNGVKRKIVMIGLDGAGKTSILNQLKVKKFMETVPTIGLNIETIQYKNLEFLVFDVGGKVRSLWSHYYDNLDAIIFVVDSTDKERLWQVKDEFRKLSSELSFQNAVVLVLFNKQDLPECVEFKALVEETGVDNMNENDIIIQKCSAKTGDGLMDGMEKLVSYFLNNDKNSSNKQNQLSKNGQTKSALVS
ncbi:hypothetical protein ABPG72_000920 [Tetrahymena utriculariae]